jgi:hypothetical protein
MDAESNPSRGWHLQVCEREWVVYWYGEHPSPDPRVGHVMPAASIIRMPGMDPMVIESELPKGYDPEFPVVVRSRPKCWGWRFRHDATLHDTGWKLADSREQCLADAAKWVDESMSIRCDERPAWRDNLKDVREYDGGIL